MPKKDDRLFIRVHEGMPEHPKIEGLSDRAFRLLVETWCWCARNRTDGRVQAASWAKRGTPKARAELAAAGLVENDLAGGVIVHDWDHWQRTADEIREYQERRHDIGAKAAHERWHVNRCIRDPGCAHCTALVTAMHDA